MRDYVAAGFDPSAFWALTPRLYSVHMEGALARIERDVEMANRQAWNTAALTGAAFGGKMPPFEKVFGRKITHGRPQSPAVVEAQLHALAAAWGASRPDK